MEKENQIEEKIDKKTLKEEAGDIELRVYEASYLLLPFITEEDIPREAARVKEYFSLSGGIIFSEEEPKLIPLAYQMSKVIANKNTKFDNAYFGWIKFEGNPENIAKVKKNLENNENVLRFLILKTTKEVVTPRKPFPFAVRSPKFAVSAKEEAVYQPAEKAHEVPQEIDEVELDKTIQDLVIE